MSFASLGLLLAGLVLLLLGAEGLVRGAAGLASRLRIPSVVIGLTVVAFGTSSPELAVSARSALAGQGSIALGNVLGSNIFNILLILGLSGVITPLVVSRQLVRLDVPVMIGVSLLIWALGANGLLSRGEGLLLVVLLVGYLGWLLRSGLREGREAGAAAEGAPESGSGGRMDSIPVQLLLVAGGLGLLVLGANWLVEGAVAIASALGVSELVIGLTIIAGGTSLPEVATSVLASIRGERDLAVGNVVGSNIFNLLAVLGITGAITPGGIPIPDAALAFDLPVMVAVALACWPIFFHGYRIDRWEAGLFLFYFVAWTAYLLLKSSGYPGLPAFSAAMLFFVIPLTVVTLGVIVVRQWRVRGRADGSPAASSE